MVSLKYFLHKVISFRTVLFDQLFDHLWGRNNSSVKHNEYTETI